MRYLYGPHKAVCFSAWRPTLDHLLRNKAQQQSATQRYIPATRSTPIRPTCSGPNQLSRDAPQPPRNENPRVDSRPLCGRHMSQFRRPTRTVLRNV